MNSIPGLQANVSNATSQTALERKISGVSQEFESVLLAQWLKDAENSFGTVPGSDGDDDAGGEMKEFAMQHLATEIARNGGVGIGNMVKGVLAKSVGKNREFLESVGANQMPEPTTAGIGIEWEGSDGAP